MVLMLLLTACSSDKGETAEKATANALNAIKSFDKDGINKYLNYNEIVNNNEDDESAVNQAKKILSGMEYKIISSEEKGDTAIVKVDITNSDMGKAMKEMIGNLFGLAMEESFKPDSEKMTAEQMEQKSFELFDEAISKYKNEKVTSTVDIELNKVDGKWKIAMDVEFHDAMMGGLLKATEDMNNSFNPSEE